MKKCIKCKKEKDSSMFYVNRAISDGLCVYCKDCDSVRQKVSLERRKRLNRAIDLSTVEGSKLCPKCKTEKEFSEFHIDRTRRFGRAGWCISCTNENRRNRKVVTKKVIARSMARKHAHEIKGDHCEQCGKSGRLYMHHPDYGKPLVVVTLCHDCHMEEHSVIKFNEGDFEFDRGSVCERCMARFTKRRVDQKYCGRDCRLATYKDPVHH